MSDIDYKRFIELYFHIVDKSERDQPFLFNSVQTKLYNNISGRDVILKARQEGVSSIILALFAVDFLLLPNSRSVCIAHDKDSTIKLFDRVKYYLKSFSQLRGVDVPMRYETKTELVNEEMNSYYYVGTAGSRSFGRSATLTNVHFSELAYYPEPEQTYLSASQAGTPKWIFIETTANGMGDFFSKLWDDARAERSNYRPHFYGWQDHTEYKAPDFAVKGFVPTEEEKKMVATFNLSPAQLEWRRAKMREFTDVQTFMQEYPLTPEEAFITSGRPVFNTDSLTFMRNKISFQKPPLITGNLVGYKPPVIEESSTGSLKIWKKPERSGQYVIGADSAEGVKGGDYACAQVIDRRSFEQVATFHQRCDPDIFARELNRLGRYYNMATIAPERNAGGIATVLVLRELDYSNIYIREKVGQITDRLTPELGWLTDMKTKPLMISNTQKAIRDKLVIVHDEATINELFSYQYDDAGHANAPNGSHDDRVIALMIAVEMYNRIPIDDQNSNLLGSPQGRQFGFDPLGSAENMLTGYENPVGDSF